MNFLLRFGVTALLLASLATQAQQAEPVSTLPTINRLVVPPPRPGHEWEEWFGGLDAAALLASYAVPAVPG